MAAYAYKCRSCHKRFVVHATFGCPPSQPKCDECGGVATGRDYAAEPKRVHIPMHMSSKNTTSKSDFLPSTADFESPTDPTGDKGMKEWKDTHQVKGSRWI